MPEVKIMEVHYDVEFCWPEEMASEDNEKQGAQLNSRSVVEKQLHL